MQKITQALKSRTVWLAIAQAILGIAVVVLTEADMLGAVSIVKSLGDIFLRSITTEPLSQK